MNIGLAVFADPANPEATAQEWCGCDLPVVELEYPAIGAKERYVEDFSLPQVLQWSLTVV